MSEHGFVALAYVIGTTVVCALLIKDGLRIMREYPSRRTLTRRQKSASADALRATDE